MAHVFGEANHAADFIAKLSHTLPDGLHVFDRPQAGLGNIFANDLYGPLVPHLQKVKLEYITDDLKRKASFRKRKENVVKKTNELNILCDVDAAAIIYSGRSADSHPQVWPDDGGVHRFLDKYHGRSVLEKTLNQEGLIQQRLHKEKEHLKKRSNENKEEEISQLMINYMGGHADPTMVSENALRLKMLVEKNLKEIDRVMEATGKEDDEVYVPAPPIMSEEGLLINRENENEQINLHHHGMGSGNWNSPSSCWNNLEDLEYYMGFGSSEMPQDFQNANFQNAASSSSNPFYP
ncbi:agamous-like MADS-box protein AGL80 [Senna tora]|uniref:Agamous-like MADS-box protein AGL80 n=1 Tax=Senna tora TaxID=362788 RepID=A0A834WGX7_9FABA|nr:agamous-like MADS-box protein AGL80 [Senna tora]